MFIRSGSACGVGVLIGVGLLVAAVRIGVALALGVALWLAVGRAAGCSGAQALKRMIKMAMMCRGRTWNLGQGGDHFASILTCLSCSSLIGVRTDDL